MQTDIDIDFDRLRLSNDKLYYWSGKLGVKKRDFLKFAFRLSDEAEMWKASMDKEEMRRFSGDVKEMLYAKEIEDMAVRQYAPMVRSILRKFTIGRDQFDDHLTEGLLAVRCAVWHFRTHIANANFTTFCHHSISKRIKWYRGKAYRKALRRASKCKMTLFTDISGRLTLGGVEHLPWEGDLSEVNAIDSLVKACCLSEEDRFLLHSYMGREDAEECWFNEYNRRYTAKSRQGIQYQLHRIQKKVYYALRQAGMVPEGFMVVDKR